MKSDQLSQTAAFVAIKFYGLTQLSQFRSLFDDRVVTFYERLVGALPSPLGYYHYWLRRAWVRRLYLWSEELLLPGDLLHVVGRKWYLHKMTQQFIDDGYEQLIVLGAGFDHLGYYFTQEGVECLELDATHMAKIKQQLLDQNYSSQPMPHITGLLLPDDNLGHALGECRQINPHKKTVVVAEGFFDYLTPQTTKRTLKDISDFFSHDTALLSTHFALNELSLFYRTVFKSSVQLVNEPLQLHASMTDFENLLAAHNFSICQQHDSQQIRTNMQRQANTKLAMLDGFYLIEAHKN
jgi:O-methyltransferase involved in polyketide biosynthesis